MNLGPIANTATNVLVIAGIGIYFVAGLSPREQRAKEAMDATVNLSMSAAEWERLIHGAPTVGHAPASPFAVEFIDYECPYCRSSHSEVVAYLSAARGGAIAVRQYPLPMHAAAEGAARAALCADEQGRFERMHTRLLTDTLWHGTEDWMGLAQDVEMPDAALFHDCLSSERVTEALEVDRQLAEDFGVRATPTFLTFGAFHEGSINRRILDGLASRVRP